MFRTSLSRVILLGVIALMLVVPSLQAGEILRTGPILISSGGWHADLWSFVTRLWLKNGCRIDPSGLCISEPETATSVENGCHIDPSGYCLTTASAPAPSENGCSLDPNGLCLK